MDYGFIGGDKELLNKTGNRFTAYLYDDSSY